MSDYIVSARKYRPQLFDSVVGQEHITTTLKNAIVQNHLAHAYLFCGPRGVGKTTCARILAKTINCQNLTKENEACDTCESCISFNNGTSFNFFELDAASNNGVEHIRELVEQVRFTPQAGKYKVYIIDEVHMLSNAAFNAFLKTLEEPPAHAIFILATTEKHKIITTILSRCQIFDFKRITTKDTVNHLISICKKENIQYEEQALHLIAQKSEGCMRDSLSILDKIVSFTSSKLNYADTLEHLNILDETYFFEIHQQFLNEEIADVFLTYETIYQKGFEGDTFINNLAAFYRNVLLSKDEKTVSLLDVAENFKVKYLDVAQKTPLGWLVTALHYLNECEIEFKSAKNKRLHVELCLTKLCFLNQALQINNTGGSEQSKNSVVHFKIASPKRFLVKNKKKNEEQKAKIEIEIEETQPQKAEKKADEKTDSKSEINTQISITENTVIKPSVGLGSLKKIREKIEAKEEKKFEDRLITHEEVVETWNKYIALLKETNTTTANNLLTCILDLKENNTVIVTAISNFARGFVETQKTEIIQFFKRELLIQNIVFDIPLLPEEKNDAEPILSTKEKYLKLVEQYPLLEVLRKKLNLELDY